MDEGTVPIRLQEIQFFSYLCVTNLNFKIGMTSFYQTSYQQRGNSFVSLKAPITTNFVCFCRLLNVLEAYTVNSVGPGQTAHTLFASILKLVNNRGNTTLTSE